MIKQFRFGTGVNQLAPQSGRYHLVVSPQCPWCRRITIARRLLGLTQAIGISVAAGRGEDGFEFFTKLRSCDPTLRIRTSRELYRRQEDWEIGEPTTVPALVDLHQKGKPIVSASSDDLLVDLATAWKELHAPAAPDLYPQNEQAALKELDEFIHNGINSNIYALVHGEDQHEAKIAWTKISQALVELNETLGESNYLCGDELRGADIRLFTSLQSLVEKTETRGETPQELFKNAPNVARWFAARRSEPGWITEGEPLYRS